MQINTNMSSLLAQGSLQNTQNAMQNALAKLSSGYRINQASDDAAGYAITQKMNGQVNGLGQATQNAQNAISLTQVAQGALNETENILQRMRVLAVQSASDTSTDSDRQQIQLETNQLAIELSRISNTTEFNTKNLLSGAFSNQIFQIGANQGQNLSVNISAMDSYSLGVASIANVSVNAGFTQNSGLLAANAITITSASPLSIGVNYAITATEVTGSITSTALTGAGLTNVGTTLVATSTLAAGTSYQLQSTANANGTGVTFSLLNSQGVIIGTTSMSFAAANSMANGSQIVFSAQGGTATGITLTLTAATIVSNNSATITFNENTANTLTFSLSSNTGAQIETKTGVAFGVATAFTMSYSGLTVNLTSQTYTDAVGSWDVTGLSVTGTTSTAAVVAANGVVTTNASVAGGVLMDTQSRANAAITTINTAINTVSTALAQLGAVQNRLTHTISNLGVASQNMTAAMGNIKNVDMAAEMSEFTKDQVLSQAGVAMLAQANQVPQMILKLLG